MPVPGPTMITGSDGSSGSRKCFALWKNSGTGVSASTLSARNVEAMPLRWRPWLS